MTKGTRDTILQLEGITTALATPLTETGGLDVEGLERLVKNHIEKGVSCIFALGWCGEGPLLPDSVREAVIRETCRIANGRVLVMIGVSDQSVERARPMIRVAEESGADLILSTPPYSYDVPPELVENFFISLTKETQLPLVIYENKEIGVQVGLESLKRLGELDQIVGVKATVPAEHLRQYHHQLTNMKRFVVISGDEFIFSYALLLGIRHFTMGGLGNFSARWCTDMIGLAKNEQWEEVVTKQGRMMQFLNAVYGYRATGNATPDAVGKYILSQLGYGSDQVSSPHRRLKEEEKHNVRSLMEEYRDLLD